MYHYGWESAPCIVVFHNLADSTVARIEGLSLLSAENIFNSLAIKSSLLR